MNVNTTPAVRYAWTEMSGGQNNSRPVSMTYPSGYVVNYNYGAGLDSSISRLTSLSDSGGVLESYKYLGLGTVVERDHPQNNVNLTYISQTGGTGDAGDQYTGLDRFSRVVDQNWYNTATHSSTDDFKYGYDRDSNVLSRQNALNAIFSEGYTYDALNQLTSFSRGSHTQGWAPDALGNFTTVTTDGVPQARTHNQQNEITVISGAGVVTYDANGNLTADGSGKTFVYDAWNRLVAVKSGLTTLASYQYDGLGRRITETHGATTTDLYYSSAWQVLEERVGGVAQARNVWSPVYVNALVLRDQSSQQNGVLDQRLYVQQDANWNVTAITDVSGNVLERYAPDPYGAVAVLAPNWSARGASAYGWLYYLQGMRLDPATGLYRFGIRDFSPTLMRPMQGDPLGLGPDNNAYRPEGDNPTGRVDPSGLEWLAPWDPRAQRDFGAAFISAQWQAFTDAVDVIPHPAPQALPRPPYSPPSIFPTGMNQQALEYQNSLIKAHYDRLQREHGWTDAQTARQELWDNFARSVGPPENAGDTLNAWDMLNGLGPLGSGSVGVRGIPGGHKMESCPNGPEQAEREIPDAVNCFPAGTLLGAEFGLQVIEGLGPGDRVWAHDFATARWSLRDVKTRFERLYDGDVVEVEVLGERIRATADHPFWVTAGQELAARPAPRHVKPYEAACPAGGRWVNARDLRVGDALLVRAGGTAAVEGLSSRRERLMVYNIHVAEVETYAVGEAQVLVHNRPPAESEPSQAAPERMPIDVSRVVHGTAEHDATAFRVAKLWENDPATVESRFNQDLVDAAGNRVPRFRPDAQRIRQLPDGRRVVDVVEIQSPGQSRKFMDDKVRDMRRVLGPDAGIIIWLPPTPGATR